MIAKHKSTPISTKVTLPDHILKSIEESRLSAHPESNLIAILQAVQQHYGYLSPARLDEVAQLMQIPTAKVSGVATFYHFFSFVPRGKHRITVCMGTACYVKGSGKILERLKEVLGTDVGHSTVDGLFSLEPARCLGACAMAPVVVVDEKVYGNVSPDAILKILAEYGFVAKSKSA